MNELISNTFNNNLSKVPEYIRLKLVIIKMSDFNHYYNWWKKILKIKRVFHRKNVGAI